MMSIAVGALAIVSVIQSLVIVIMAGDLIKIHNRQLSMEWRVDKLSHPSRRPL